MFEDAPVNAGAVQWPDANSAFWTVRSMQIKLHRWASEDAARRFGDLLGAPRGASVTELGWKALTAGLSQQPG